MAKTRIKWNISTFQKIRRLDTVDDMLQRIVDDILSEVGEGYVGSVTAGRTRSRGSVVTAEAEAVIDNSENQSLLRSLSTKRVGG